MRPLPSANASERVVVYKPPPDPVRNFTLFWSCFGGAAVCVCVPVPVLYSCVFAYGQTGSGKSYTMMGAGGGGSDNPQRGLTPRLCEDLFQRISAKVEAEAAAGWAAKVEVSYMEIYLEMVRDLLSSNPDRKLKVREHQSTGPYVEDLSSHAVTSYKEVKALMDDGDKVRMRRGHRRRGHQRRGNLWHFRAFPMAEFSFRHGTAHWLHSIRSRPLCQHAVHIHLLHSQTRHTRTLVTLRSVFDPPCSCAR